MSASVLPLAGRTAVVTGTGRRRGIGHAIAGRLASMGASICVQHWAQHDADQPWGADDLAVALDELRAGLQQEARLVDVSLDLSADEAPAELVSYAANELGHLDVLVCNHARSGADGPLRAQTAATLDGH